MARSSRAEDAGGDTVRGGQQLEQLTQRMLTSTPACANDGRFIEDNPDPATTTALRRVCFGCDLLAACNAFAKSAKPEAGFWAGTDYSTRRLGRPPKEAADAAGSRS
ncbi:MULTISPECIES: WhiB family transcriptional regulator [unclassified Microbacterium]|uniref:WhiB family transcriptional regulator n=1 Tax=unclassified Microbacterium TaxID=2609290 RepID=UPI001604A1B1|nr:MULTISPECIES: WhiB family transcriptional regulator [unclassified Microbacterium]MBT2483367.1 WhiB family transcriptional regulator [Microbacterium sp. ISL-108]